MPVETKCEIARAKARGESYSPIPQVIVVLLSLFKRDDREVKYRCVRQVGLLSTAGVDS